MGDGDGATSGACMVIEGVVYGDGDGDASGKDYAEYVFHCENTLDIPLTILAANLSNTCRF